MPLARLLLLGLLTVAVSADADVYSWKDKTGKTIFSDRPPVESQSADTVDGVDDAKKNAKSKTPQGKTDDDPRSRVAKEDARKKQVKEAEEREKKLVAWRCADMEKQKKTAQEQYDKLLASDPKKAAVLKTDIDNYQDTMDKICK